MEENNVAKAHLHRLKELLSRKRGWLGGSPLSLFERILVVQVVSSLASLGLGIGCWVLDLGPWPGHAAALAFLALSLVCGLFITREKRRQRVRDAARRLGQSQTDSDSWLVRELEDSMRRKLR